MMGSYRETGALRLPSFRPQGTPATALLNRRPSLVVRASSTPPPAPAGLLQRLGRVLKEKATGDYERFFKGATKTRQRLGLVEELLTFWKLEDYEESMDELEEALIAADFGPKTALKIVDKIRVAIKSGKAKTSTDIRTCLKASIVELLTPRAAAAGGVAGTSELRLTGKPSVLLVVGVNGAGKTTTIGKLATKLGREGAKVYVVPGDTFRAAAAEQLAEWARRSGATMGPFQEGKRPATVIAACCEDAKTRDPPADVVICDTAGRLHTAYALMEELQECKEAIAKVLPGQPDEVLLVLDGTTGLNMLNQAREFNGTVRLTGLILTKLDGSARGGAVVSVVDALGLPVKFVGVGETVEDLQAFDPTAFAEALFPAV